MLISKKHGLSLLEAVIALAITGVVIGLLWIAMAPIAQRQKVNNTSSAIVMLANKIRSLYGDQPIMAATTDINNAQLIQANIVPAALVKNNAIVHRLGTANQAITVTKGIGPCNVTAGAATKSDFTITLANVDQNYCPQLVMTLAGTRNTAAQNQLMDVFVAGSSVMASQAATADTVENQCSGAATVPVILCFAQ